MSLDLYLVGARCEHCNRDGETFFDLNVTHNLTGMWSKAGIYDALYMSDGQRAGDHLPALEKGLADMLLNKEDYELLNPPNGWGNYEGAVRFLQSVIEGVKEHPDATFSVSK